MANQQSPSGPLAHLHHYAGPAPARPQPNGQVPVQQPPPGKQNTAQYLAQSNEMTWLSIGNVHEMFGELDAATASYERALNFNQWCVPAMLAISSILRSKDQFAAAVEYLKTILKVDPTNGALCRQW